MATKGQRTREKKDPEQQVTLPSSARVYGGRYAAREELGRGGMGRVLRAHDMKLGRDVALKILAPGAQEQQRLRFEQEARAAGALNHPNIVDVHDVGEQDGEPFIVTELLEGETLRTLLSRGPLAPAHALELATQLAEGLAAAHGAGIVHRDIKMSPEQVQGEHATARSDIFAFGAVLHEMLSGKGPFERHTAVDSAHAILHDPPAPLPPSTPDPLARLIGRCLQKDPAARLANGGEVLAEMRKISLPPPRTKRALLL